MSALVLATILFFQTPAAPQRTNGVVTGRILNKNGSPSARLRVSALAAMDSGVQTEAGILASLAETDDAGNYRLENIPPGKYYIIAGSLDLPAYYPGVSSLSAAKTISITTGITVNDIDFVAVVRSGLTVSGRVVQLQPTRLDAPPLPSGLAGPALIVEIVGNPPQTRQSVAVQSDGTFRFDRVRPGNYTFGLNRFVRLIQPVAVEVRDEDVSGVVITIPVIATVRTTTVMDGSSAKPPNFALRVAGITTSVTGPIEVLIPEGEHSVTVAELPPQFFVKSMTSNSIDLLRNPAKFSGTTTIAVTIGAYPPTHLNGHVVTLPGMSTPEGIHIERMGEPRDAFDSPIGPDGAFVFSSVLPGPYSISFKPEAEIAAAGVPVTVPPTGMADARIEGNIKEVRGKVTVENGSPPATLTFLVGGEIGPKTGAPRMLVLGAAILVKPLENGSFHFFLPEGDFNLGVDTDLLESLGYRMKSLNGQGGEHPVLELRITASQPTVELRVILTR